MSTPRCAVELADSYEVAYGGNLVTGGRRKGFKESQEDQSQRQSEGGNWHPPLAEKSSFSQQPQSKGPAEIPRNQTSSGELCSFWCRKVGHKKNKCFCLTSKHSAAKPVGTVSAEQKRVHELRYYERFICQDSQPVRDYWCQLHSKGTLELSKLYSGKVLLSYQTLVFTRQFPGVPGEGVVLSGCLYISFNY